MNYKSIYHGKKIKDLQDNREKLIVENNKLKLNYEKLKDKRLDKNNEHKVIAVL